MFGWVFPEIGFGKRFTSNISTNARIFFDFLENRPESHPAAPPPGLTSQPCSETIKTNKEITKKPFRFFNLFSQNHFRPQLGTSQALCCEGPLASPTRSRTPPQPGNHHLHLYLPPVALHFLYRNHSFGVIIITML